MNVFGRLPGLGKPAVNRHSSGPRHLQTIDVDEKGCQDESRWDAILEASGVKLRVPTTSMIVRAMCLSGRSCS